MSIFKNIVMLLLLMLIVTSCCNCPTEMVSQDMGIITKKRMRFRYYGYHTMTAPYRVYLITAQQQSFRVPRDTFDKYKEGDHYYRYKVVRHHLDTCIYSSNYRNDNIWE